MDETKGMELIVANAYTKMKNNKKSADIKKAIDSIFSNVYKEIEQNDEYIKTVKRKKYKNPETSMNIESLTPSEVIINNKKNISKILYEYYKNLNKVSKDKLSKIAKRFYDMGIIKYIPRKKWSIVLTLIYILAAIIIGNILSKDLQLGIEFAATENIENIGQKAYLLRPFFREGPNQINTQTILDTIWSILPNKQFLNPTTDIILIQQP